MPGWAPAALTIVAGAALLWLIAGVGFVNYDTLYGLVWGQQLSRGEVPEYGLPIAPTPHPLVEMLGVPLAPLGASASTAIVVALGFLSLSACGWVIYRLGSAWFGRAAGVVAAGILLTRVPVLSYGVRAYVDIPYLLLILSALLVESRHRRAGAPVLVLLGLAGLLRPEAWAFSGVYWLYLLVSSEHSSSEHSEHPSSEHSSSEHSSSEHSSSEHPFPEHSFPEHSSEHSFPEHSSEHSFPEHSYLVRTRGQAHDRHSRQSRRSLAWLALLAVAAPAIWVLSDLLVTGNAMWSLTNTKHTAATLGRATGFGDVPQYIPRRIGEVLRPAVLAGAALGGVLTLAWLRERARLGAIAGVAAVIVFAVMAGFGLPIDTRYAFLAGAVLCVFCGAGVFGWSALPKGDHRRLPWMLAGGVVLVALLITLPGQVRSAHHELSNLSRQQSIQDDLLALVDSKAITSGCGPVGVPNHAPIPLLALYLKVRPALVVSAEAHPIQSGSYVDPASIEVEQDYVLDPRDPHRAVSIPPGFTAANSNRSWLIFEHCS
jgi:hypothetical protein